MFYSLKNEVVISEVKSGLEVGHFGGRFGGLRPGPCVWSALRLWHCASTVMPSWCRRLALRQRRHWQAQEMSLCEIFRFGRKTWRYEIWF